MDPSSISVEGWTLEPMNAALRSVLLIQLGSTWAMVGLIWFVQVVHYPLFAEVGRESFQRYEREHQRLTTWVVAPLMLAEMSTAVLMIWWRPSGVGDVPIGLGIALLASIWLMTYTVQVPLHASLAKDFEPQAQRRLVLSNWYRTAAWTGRGLLILWMLNQVLTRGAWQAVEIARGGGI